MKKDLEFFLKKCRGVKWKERLVKELYKSSNKDLFESTLEMQFPDDYDSCYTSQGEFEQKISLLILVERLKESGFLKVK